MTTRVPTLAHAIVATFWAILAAFVLLVTAVFGALPAAIPLYVIGLTAALIGALLVTRPSPLVLLASLVGGLAVTGILAAGSSWSPVRRNGHEGRGSALVAGIVPGGIVTQSPPK